MHIGIEKCRSDEASRPGSTLFCISSILIMKLHHQIGLKLEVHITQEVPDVHKKQACAVIRSNIVVI